MKIQRKTNLMENYQKRVLDEKADLEVKLISLTQFINSINFAILVEEESLLLFDQLIAMREYFNILKLRVARF